MTYHATFAALADPTRRGIFEQLRSGERSFADISRSQTVSKAAVSQHLKVLREAQLVAVRYQGKKGFFRAENEGLRQLRDYVDGFWSDVLAAFTDFTEKEGHKR